jgi:hypothetical protein
LSFRVTAQLRSRLEEAASKNGRSLTAELEDRLTRSLDRDDVARRLDSIQQTLDGVFAKLSALPAPEREPYADLVEESRRRVEAAVEATLADAIEGTRRRIEATVQSILAAAIKGAVDAALRPHFVAEEQGPLAKTGEI